MGTGNKRGRGLCRKLFFKGEVMGIPAGIEKIQKKKDPEKGKVSRAWPRNKETTL